MEYNISSKIDPMLFKKVVRNLKIQKFADHLIFLFLGRLMFLVLRFVRGYKIKNIKEVREKYKKIISIGQPILICPNHLTMIDSLILHLAFGSITWYFFHFNFFSWNLPAIENFKSKLIPRVITYLGKCIPIDRKGTQEHIELVLEQVRYLLRKKEVFLVFPEGGRSRSGRIELENTTYGIGKIIQDVENLKVLCVYMRGDNQLTYSYQPKNGDEFYIDMELITPQSDKKGLRATRDNSLQVMTKLKEMEDLYFKKSEQNDIPG